MKKGFLIILIVLCIVSFIFVFSLNGYKVKFKDKAFCEYIAARVGNNPNDKDYKSARCDKNIIIFNNEKQAKDLKYLVLNNVTSLEDLKYFPNVEEIEINGIDWDVNFGLLKDLSKLKKIVINSSDPSQTLKELSNVEVIITLDDEVIYDSKKTNESNYINVEKYNSLSAPININNTTDVDINKTALDINSDLAKKLYIYIMANNNRLDNYKGIKVTINDISEQLVLSRAFKSYIFENNNCNVDKITPTTLKNKIKEIYKINNVTDYSQIEDGPTGGWYYRNGEYNPAGGTPDYCPYVFYEHINNKIVKITKDENNIYMYTEFYYSTSSIDQYRLYADYNGYLNDEKINYDENSFPGESVTYNLTDYIKDNYPNLIYTYKHTFTKDNVGNYYWVSSEPLTK